MFIATVNYFTVGHYAGQLFRKIMYYIVVLRTTFHKRETRNYRVWKDRACRRKLGTNCRVFTIQGTDNGAK